MPFLGAISTTSEFSYMHSMFENLGLDLRNQTIFGLKRIFLGPKYQLFNCRPQPATVVQWQKD